MLELQLLNKAIHDRKGFDCGVPHLNDHLAKQASSSADRLLTKTYVLVDTEQPSEIIGFYTLCYCSVKVPLDYKPLQRYPHSVPALKLARMGVSIHHKGHRFGEQLLVDVIEKAALTVNADNPASVIGIFVDAKEGVEGFYKKYGFVPVGTEDTQQLWLSIGNCIDVAHI